MNTTTNQPTCYVAPITFDASNFRCSGKTAQETGAEFQAKLVESCQIRGFLVATDESTAEIRIAGRLTEVNEGSRVARYFLALLAGKAFVRAEFDVTHGDAEAVHRVHEASARAGFFGGSGPRLISGCLERIAVQVAGEAAATAQTGIVTARKPVITYFASIVACALLVACISALVASSWAHGLPRTNNSIKPEEIPVWTLVLGLGLFVGMLCSATAFAPIQVLNSTSLLWLLRVSGVKKPSALRILIGVFAIIAFGVVTLCFLVAPG
jgi:hypothetical protein